MIYFKVLS